MTPAACDHLPELDGLRGLAILFVLIFHYDADLPLRLPLPPILWGWSGVDLFFVLSGFLITRILIRTRERANYFRGFYIRRALRIFPLYYSVLAVCGLLAWMVPALRTMFPSAHDQFFHWLYLSNWVPLLNTADQRPIAHFWSLAIEEQFYWVWPFVVWKLRPRSLPAVAASGVAAALVLRLLLYGTATDPFVYRSAICRMDGLMAGALCAILATRPGFTDWVRQRLALLLCASVIIWELAVAGGARWHDHFTYTIGFTLFDASYALLLLYLVHAGGWLQKAFRSKLPRALGRYSYGIYVFHQIVYYAFKEYHVAPRGWPVLVSSLGISLALAVASYELMEKRFLRLKEKLAG